MHCSSSMEQLSGSDKSRTQLARAALRGRSSKYDMVKVKVFLGDHMEHHYVLSRFLISRMLTVTRIPNSKATKIALDLKKHLVDHNLLEVKQADLEAILFSLMDAKGFGEQHVSCYRLVSSFMAARQPLVILLCGAPWTGKSTITQQLAARLNMPNVLRTELVYTILRDGGLLPKYAAPAPPPPTAEQQQQGQQQQQQQQGCRAPEPVGLHRQPVYARSDLSGEAEMLAEFQRECALVQHALEGDLNKAITDGKPLILEGGHLDPGLLLHRLTQVGLVMLPASGAGEAWSHLQQEAHDASTQHVNGVTAGSHSNGAVARQGSEGAEAGQGHTPAPDSAPAPSASGPGLGVSIAQAEDAQASSAAAEGSPWLGGADGVSGRAPTPPSGPAHPQPAHRATGESAAPHSSGAGSSTQLSGLHGLPPATATQHACAVSAPGLPFAMDRHLEELTAVSPPTLPPLPLSLPSSFTYSDVGLIRTASSSGPEADSPYRHPYLSPNPSFSYQPHHYSTHQPHPPYNLHAQPYSHTHARRPPQPPCSSGVEDSMSASGTGCDSIEGDERRHRERGVLGLLLEGALSSDALGGLHGGSASPLAPGASKGMLLGPVVAWPPRSSISPIGQSHSHGRAPSPLPFSSAPFLRSRSPAQHGGAAGCLGRPQSAQGVPAATAATGHGTCTGSAGEGAKGGRPRAWAGARVTRNQSMPANLAESARALQRGVGRGSGTPKPPCGPLPHAAAALHPQLPGQGTLLAHQAWGDQNIQQQQQQQQQQQLGGAPPSRCSSPEGAAPALHCHGSELPPPEVPAQLMHGHSCPSAPAEPLLMTGDGPVAALPHPADPRTPAGCGGADAALHPGAAEGVVGCTPEEQAVNCQGGRPELEEEGGGYPGKAWQGGGMPVGSNGFHAGGVGGAGAGLHCQTQGAAAHEGWCGPRAGAGAPSTASAWGQPHGVTGAAAAAAAPLPPQQHGSGMEVEEGMRRLALGSPDLHPRSSTPTRAIQPLFVPIILQMPSENEHALMAEDCAPDTHHASMSLPSLKHPTSLIATSGREGGGGGLGSQAVLPSLPLREQLQRVRHLQQYLTNFEAQQGVPVVQVKYGSFGETVDMLHQYILTCITTAMEWMQEDEQAQHLCHQPPAYELHHPPHALKPPGHPPSAQQHNTQHDTRHDAQQGVDGDCEKQQPVP